MKAYLETLLEVVYRAICKIITKTIAQSKTKVLGATVELILFMWGLGPSMALTEGTSTFIILIQLVDMCQPSTLISSPGIYMVQMHHSGSEDFSLRPYTLVQ